ncbi:MAG: hypothetical protein AB1646_24830 [Thermodesulfobacteriota bacterium]
MAIPEPVAAEPPPVIQPESGLRSSPRVLEPEAGPDLRSEPPAGDDTNRTDSTVARQSITALPCPDGEPRLGQESSPTADRMPAQEPPEQRDPDLLDEHPPADAASPQIPQPADQEPAAEVRTHHRTPMQLRPDHAPGASLVAAASIPADTPLSPDIPWAEILPDPERPTTQSQHRLSQVGPETAPQVEVTRGIHPFGWIPDLSEEFPARPDPVPEKYDVVQWSDVSSLLESDVLPHADQHTPVPDSRTSPEPVLLPPYWITNGPPIPALLFGCAVLWIALCM